MKTTVAFIGLGKMGAGMAESLLRAGFPLRLYNRTATRNAPFVARGATAYPSPAEAARGADFVISMLADDAALLAVTLGEDGLIAGMGPEAIHLSASTVSTEATRHLAEAHRARGGHFVATPIMGRPDVAAAGQVWIAAAGPRELEARCRPVFEALGRGYTWLGDDPTVASAMKIAANSLLLNAIEAISEAFTVVEKIGGDRAAFLELVRPLLSTPFAAYAERMVSGVFEPPGFSTTLAVKDASLMVRLGEDVHAPTPAASVAHAQLITGVARGRGEWDLAGLIEVSREKAGLA